MSRPSQYADRTKPRIEAAEAYCQACDWAYFRQGNLTGLQEAVRYHVRTHAHEVTVRDTRVVIYSPKGAA